jgi:benzil reductase ((S)-benzoin forming)
MNILITGTSKGLGYGLAKYYLDKGHCVFGISRKVNTELQAYSGFSFLSLDLFQFGEIENNIPQFLSDVTSLDLVVLNAGVLNGIKDMKDTSLKEIKYVMDINVWSNKVLIDVLFEHINKIRQIVAISSGASVSGSRGWNAYSLSKATLNMLISLYAKEYTDTHFCTLAPGLIDTNMQEYISGLPEDERFPAVKKLKKAKGTQQMPNPGEAAKIVAGGIKKALNDESGAFLDVRTIS